MKFKRLNENLTGDLEDLIFYLEDNLIDYEAPSDKRLIFNSHNKALKVLSIAKQVGFKDAWVEGNTLYLDMYQNDDLNEATSSFWKDWTKTGPMQWKKKIEDKTAEIFLGTDGKYEYSVTDSSGNSIKELSYADTLSDAKNAADKYLEEKLDEASYGGAYDIADDQLFTRDELNEFGEIVAEVVSQNSQSTASYVSAYIENGELEITLEMQDYEETVKVKLDNRKFRHSFDLYKAYGPKVVKMFIEKFTNDEITFGTHLSDQDYPYDESLEEAVEKKIVDIDNNQLMKTITDEASKFIIDTLMYDQDFVDDYLFVDVNDYDDYLVKVEVRTELDYEQLDRLGDYLNGFVKDIDPDAYFEPETSTILVCYLRKDQTDDVVDEEQLAKWTEIFNNCKSREEIRNRYEEARKEIDNGNMTFATMDKLFDVIGEKFDSLPEDTVDEGFLNGNTINISPTISPSIDLGGAGGAIGSLLTASYEGNKDDKNEPLEEDYADYIYLFPELTDEDIDFLKAYNLKYLGKNYGAYEDEENWVVKGDKDNLERYAQNYLGYELHPDYLYDADDFAGDIVNESLKEDIGTDYKGFIIEPVKFSAIKYGNESFDGFTYYVIKRKSDGALVSNEMVKRITGKNSIDSEDEAKSFIDNYLVNESLKESAKDVPNWFKSLCQEAKDNFGKDVYSIRDYLAEHSNIDRDTIREWYIDVRNELGLPVVWDYDEWDKTECYRDTTKLQKDEAYDPADPYDEGTPYDKYDYDELDQLFSDIWHEDDLEVLDDEDYANIYGGDTEKSRDDIALDYLDDIDECVSAKDRQEMGINYSDEEWEKYSK